MPFNLPAYDVEQFSFGPSVIYIGPVGHTPTIDVGAVRSGMNFAISRTLVDINQGNPATLVHSFVTAEAGTLNFTGLQWNLERFAEALGISPTENMTEIGLGGTLYLQPFSLKVVHVTPVGVTYELRIWKARSSGELTLNFTDDPHEFSYSFHALVATTDWAGNVLPPGSQLFKLIKIT
jgi:hypothetical protein